MTSLVDLITPTNLREEHDKFFASSTYSPIFHYIWQDQSIEPEFSIKLKYPLWDAIKQQDHPTIIEAASKLFEVEIQEDVLDRAVAITKQDGQASSGSATDLKLLFDQAFKEFDLDYEAKIVERSGFNIRPSHATKELLISEYIEFGYFSMDAEVKHEMVHVIRQVNGKHNGITPSQRFLPTEEGLATWCQDHTNNDLSQVQHAMEYVGSAVGIGSGLREIYDCFCAMGMSKELAWKRAARHKFGFVDTSIPGDILKPAMYFANAEKVDKLSQDEKLRLFIGKINMDEFQVHQAYQGVWNSDKIKNYFNI
jgi:hypothetical protein